jgi:hypothetical protein
MSTVHTTKFGFKSFNVTSQSISNNVESFSREDNEKPKQINLQPIK